MTDRMSLKRAVDPVLLFSEFLRWVGYLRNLYWIVKQLGRIAGSRRLVFWGMRFTIWIGHLRYSLPRGSLPSSLGFPLAAIGTPFLNLTNWLYLRLAIKYDPSTWYESDGLFPWSLDWGKELFKFGWDWRKPRPLEQLLV